MSHMIDVRIQLLQAANPHSIYLNTNFFSLLCPRSEPVRSEPVAFDYRRVDGWTEHARLLGGKTSLFDFSPVFTPIDEAIRTGLQTSAWAPSD
jgi:hypothetical protein